ncbi:MAG: GAF domain-containing protein [Chloroflexi bacterium]|nr:GAF domain-containing protein [Chloroflexota bacterium]
MGESILLTTLYTMIAVAEAVLAVFIFISNPKSRKNRIVAALIILFSINNISVIGMLTTFTLGSAQIFHWLLIATTFSIGPAIFLSALNVLNSKLADNKRIYPILVFFVVLPIAISILDVLGINNLIFGESLFYRSLDPSQFSAGFVQSSELTSGMLRPIFLSALIGFPIIGMIYPSLFVAVRDRKNDPANSKLGWVLFAAIFSATLLAGLRSQIGPQIAILGQNLAFTIGFTYTGLLRGSDDLSIWRLSKAMADWRMVNKLRLVIGAIALPAVIVIGIVAIAFLQTNIVNTVGSDLSTLANAEARNVTGEINRQVERLIALSNDPLLATVMTLRDASYIGQNEIEISQRIAETEAAWQTTATDSGLVETLLSRERNSTLINFYEISPAHTQIVATDRIGGLLTATERTEFYDQSTNEWWQAAYNDGQGDVFVGFPIFDDDIGQFVIEIAVPIMIPDIGGEVDGVLLSRYSLEDINTELQQVVVGETGGVVLFNQAGDWLPTEGAMTTQDPMLNWDLILQSENSWRLAPFNSVDSVIGWADTSNSDMQNFLDLRVVTHIPSDEALASVKIARNTSIVALLVIIAATVGITFILAQFITNPLSDLTQAAEKILAGETGVVAQVTGKDEIGTLASTFNNMTLQLTNLVSGLEQTVNARTADLERRAIQMETAAEVAREAAAIRDLQELLDQVSTLISERFGFYHTGIFLIDDTGEYAVLQSANSEGGQRMLARGHKLQVGKVGVVGYSAGQGEPRIAQDVGADVIYYDNPDMPATRSEMALPLMVRNQVIGVLDVQSEQANAFSAEDVQVLQTLADQIALAIENTRLFQSSQDAIEELEYLYGREIGQAWKKRIENKSSTYQYSRTGSSRSQNESTEYFDENQQKISRPITFRGHTIGSLDLMREADQNPWSDDEISLIEEIMEQTALALESARLSEQIRLRSDQIQLLQEVTALAASTLDETILLETAAQKILVGFDLVNCSIVLFEPEADTGTVVAIAALIPLPTGMDIGVGSKINTNNELTLEVIRSKKTSIIYDVHKDIEASTIFGNLITDDAEALALVPMIVRDNVIGMISLVIAKDERRLSTEDLNLLNQISAQISGALDIAHLFKAEQQARREASQRAEREHLVASITAKVRSTNDPQAIIQTAIKELRQALSHDADNNTVESQPIENITPSDDNGHFTHNKKEEKTSL